MKKKKSHSVFKSIKNDCLFTEQFDSGERMDWNDDMPPFYQRLNKLDDDRSFVILATSVLEYEIDRFLSVFIPDSKILINERTNFISKLNLVRAFKLIPSHLINIADLIRRIRNDFAHNMKIDSFADADKSEKLPAHIDELKKIWNKFENDMCYFHNGDPLILMFKDLWSVCVESFRVYENNIKLFRQEIENKDFIDHLKQLSTDLKNHRNQKDRETILKTYMPWRK